VAKQKRVSRRLPPQLVDELKDVQIIEYEITTEPIEDRQFKRLPDHIKDSIDDLYSEAQRHPQRAIPALKDLVKKYPKLPRLYNYLSCAYSGAGQKEKAEKIGVAGQTLVIVKGETKINLTNEGFMYARSNPGKLETLIKEKIDPLL